jgi:thiol-disulfide isomerase/thioredoxin
MTTLRNGSLGKTVPLVLAGIAALVLGGWASLQFRTGADAGAKESAKTPTLADVRAFFAKPHPTLQPERTASIDSLRGRKLTIVNLWATWCTPCREEMPEFVAFRKEFGAVRGIEFVGVAIDRTEPVQRFIKEQSIDYPIVFAELSAVELTKLHGNSKMALPFSYVLDEHGKILQTKLGKLTREELLAISSKTQ